MYLVGFPYSGTGDVYQRASCITSEELTTFKASLIYQKPIEVSSLTLDIKGFYEEHGFDVSLITDCNKLDSVCVLTYLAKVAPNDDKLKYALAKMELENCASEKVLGPALLVISLNAVTFSWIHLIDNPIKAKEFFESRISSVQIDKQKWQLDANFFISNRPIISESQKMQIKKLKKEEKELKSALATTSSIIRKLNIISLGVFLLNKRIKHSTF